LKLNEKKFLKDAKDTAIIKNLNLICETIDKKKFIELKLEKTSGDNPHLSWEDYENFCNENGMEYNIAERRAKDMLEEEMLEKKFKEVANYKEAFTDVYISLQTILKKYLDLREDYYSILSLWIIGTYIHKSFLTYPYIFFNAMKGSGKTRALKLIAHLSYNGEVMVSVTEAILFRTAGNATLCLDELENINSKDKAALRELLNVAYKKGAKVKRMFKKIGKKEEKQIVEAFDVYCPIAIANVSGLGDVLGNRCIPLILEKSKGFQTKLLEMWEWDDDVISVKQSLMKDIWTFMDIKTVRGEYIYLHLWGLWNSYVHIYNKCPTVLNVYNVNTRPYVLTIMEKIYKTRLYARELEIFFPLMILSIFCDDMDNTIKIAKTMVEDRLDEEVIQSRDLNFLHFIATQTYTKEELVAISDITGNFNDFMGITRGSKREITNWWVGRALCRLNLVIRSDKVGRARSKRGAVVNVKKAKEKIRMYGIEIDEKQKELPQEIEVEELLAFDTKAEAYIPCAFATGNDEMCGNVPCNEFNGMYYCRNHFEKAQK